jgi:hypothetical protein
VFFTGFLPGTNHRYAPKGPRMHAMSPPLQGLNPLAPIVPQPTKTAKLSYPERWLQTCQKTRDVSCKRSPRIGPSAKRSPSFAPAGGLRERNGSQESLAMLLSQTDGASHLSRTDGKTQSGQRMPINTTMSCQSSPGRVVVCYLSVGITSAPQPTHLCAA